MNCHRFIFGEPSGNTTADSIGSATGTLTNVTRPYPGRYGLGNAVQLQPTASSHIDFSQPVGQFGTTDFSVMLWLKTTEQQRYFDIVGNRNSPSHGNFFSMRMTGNDPNAPHGRISIEVDQDGNGTNYTHVESTIVNLNDGRWHHVAAVRGGPSLALYVDGKPEKAKVLFNGLGDPGRELPEPIRIGAGGGPVRRLPPARDHRERRPHLAEERR